MKANAPQVSIVMGSKSDWDTMRHTVETLDKLGIASEYRVASAHRTPELAAQIAREAAGRGIKVIIAGAGCAAHLAGSMAANTWLPVLGVPMEGSPLKGLDALLATVQMPGGIPVGTLAIGSAGAKNAALLAAAIIAVSDEKIRASLETFREKQTKDALSVTLP